MTFISCGIKTIVLKNCVPKQALRCI
ncbi:hypothetical protein Zm00014a_018931 [Zea mays]|uniref:Uncharacterized protein n=1 Tax=Zea mays TaxID=4577 RepID=A0A317Y2V4_MAIZE|nr:hypothetical protein Zm00014a_018931 [Zea mays]